MLAVLLALLTSALFGFHLLFDEVIKNCPAPDTHPDPAALIKCTEPENLQNLARAPDRWGIAIYLIVQLFTFQFPPDWQNLPLVLHIAKFGLPALLIFEASFLLGGRFVRWIDHGIQANLSNPILVSVGSNPVGNALLHQLHFHKVERSVLTVGLSGQDLTDLERHDIPTYAGNPLDLQTWQRSHAARAQLLILAHGTDVENLNAAVAAARYLGTLAAGKTKPRLMVLIEDNDLALQVGIALDLSPSSVNAKKSPVSWRRFSTADESARALFITDPIPSHKPDRLRRTHILILGFGPGAQDVLRNALIYGQDCAQEGPLITVIAPEPELNDFWLLEQREGLRVVDLEVADIRKIPREGMGPLPSNFAKEMAKLPKIDLACVCMPDGDGIAAGLALASDGKQWFQPKGRVAIYQSREDQLLMMIANQSPNASPKIAPFGALFPRASLDHLLNYDPDAIARELHVYYCKTSDQSDPKTGTYRPWESIPENKKESNRTSAWHAKIKLAAVGHTYEKFIESKLDFTSAEIDALAIIEHRRWWAERTTQHWKFGKRSDIDRIHPDMVSYARLSDKSKDKDKSAVMGLPEVLRNAAVKYAQ